MPESPLCWQISLVRQFADDTRRAARAGLPRPRQHARFPMAAWSSFRFNCGREMRNRFAIAPLTTNSSRDDGTVSESELAFMQRRAVTGFGAVVSSAAYIENDGRSWQGIGAAHEGRQVGFGRVHGGMGVCCFGFLVRSLPQPIIYYRRRRLSLRVAESAQKADRHRRKSTACFVSSLILA